MNALNLLLLVPVLHAVACGGSAPPPAEPATAGAATAAREPTPEERCRDAARACGEAILSGNHDGMVECLPAEAVKAAGGRDELIKAVEKVKAELAKEGISIESAEVDAPTELAEGGKRLFAIVPQRVILKMPDGRLLQQSFLVGVSDDNGETWKFIDGAPLNNENVKDFFPEFPATLTLPTKAKPERLP